MLEIDKEMQKEYLNTQPLIALIQILSNVLTGIITDSIEANLAIIEFTMLNGIN